MEIIAQKREKLGKQAQALKAERKIPAVLFGKGLTSQPISIGQLQFQKVYKEAGETSLVDLNIDGKTEKVLIKEIQQDPVSLNTIHVGFYKVNLKEKINAAIPVEVIGEEKNPLLKSGAALVLVLLNEIQVEALPQDLPNHFTVDVSTLKEVGDSVTIAQLEFDRTKVEILDHEADDDIVKLDHAQMAAEPAEEAVAVDEAEAISKVAATKELSEEEKAKRAEAEKAEKAEKAKKEKK